MTNSTHWEAYYRSGSVPTLPSQFAVFVLGEYPETRAAIEFGCGTGRDAFFFASQGIYTVGIDASKAALAAAQGRRQDSQLPIKFLQADISLAESAAKIDFELSQVPEGPILLYARFFIHAIDETTEKTLLKIAGRVLAHRRGVFGVEFRTHRDQHQTKVTPSHYRRFVDPIRFAARARAGELELLYSVEGFGYAKYLHDDAHVARMLFRSTRYQMP